MKCNWCRCSAGGALCKNPEAVREGERTCETEKDKASRPTYVDVKRENQ